MRLLKKQEEEQDNNQKQDEVEDQLLDFYHIDQVEDLVKIMISRQKSRIYNRLRTQKIPQVDLKNLKTIKSSIKYKKQALKNIFTQLYHMRQRQKTKKQRNTQEKKGNKHRDSNFSSEYYQFIGQYTINKTKKQLQKQKQLLQISHYSYQQLQSFFEINKNHRLCQEILLLKYFRNQIICGHKIRKEFWLLIIASHQQTFNIEFYQNLLSYRPYNDYFSKIIHADVIRTVHDIMQKQKQQMMERILISYARKNPFVGYCQGMNFILNFILTMGFSEEQSFFILQDVIENIVPMGYYTNMSGVAVDIKIMEYLIKILYPQIYKNLVKIQMDLSVLVLEWFVCLFTSTLPFYLLVITWDHLLLQKSLALFKTTLILLEYMAPIISEATDFAHFFKLYEQFKKKMNIQELTFLRKYNSYYINEQILKIVRNIVEIEIKKSKEQFQQSIKKTQSWKDVQCDKQQPICHQLLKKQKSQDLESQVWIFKQQGMLKLNSDYLIYKQKRFPKLAQEQEQKCKKLVIGRMHHICLSETAKGKKFDNFELSQMGISQMQPEQQQYQFGMSAAFYRRATRNTFLFQNFRR